MESNNNLKWLCFSGSPDDFPIYSPKFLAFAQPQGLFETLTADNGSLNGPIRSGDNPRNEKRTVHDAAEEPYRRSLDDIEKRKNTLWCYLSLALYSNKLMLVRHDCVDHMGVSDGHKAWGFSRRVPKQRNCDSGQSIDGAGSPTAERG